jgi:hypothetical protein
LKITDSRFKIQDYRFKIIGSRFTFLSNRYFSKIIFLVSINLSDSPKESTTSW